MREPILSDDDIDELVQISLDNNVRNMRVIARMIQHATLQELANRIQKMPFGDTASSFAVYVREQASPDWVEAKAIKERYTEPRLCTTCKHMPKEGYCGKVCIDKNKWEWAD